jgi:hypothetical protein
VAHSGLPAWPVWRTCAQAPYGAAGCGTRHHASPWGHNNHRVMPVSRSCEAQTCEGAPAMSLACFSGSTEFLHQHPMCNFKFISSDNNAALAIGAPHLRCSPLEGEQVRGLISQGVCLGRLQEQQQGSHATESLAVPYLPHAGQGCSIADQLI